MFFQKLPCMLPNLHNDIWIMDMVKAKEKNENENEQLKKKHNQNILIGE